jgi:hypothetical protein
MKHTKLIRLGEIFFYILMAVCVVLIVVFYLNTGKINTEDPVGKQIADFGGILDYMLFWTYILAGMAVLFAIGFPIIRMFSNPKAGLKTLFSVLALAAIFFVAYQLGSDKVMNIAGYTGPDNIPARLKLTDMAIFSMYALIAGSVLAVIYSAVSRLFK